MIWHLALAHEPQAHVSTSLLEMLFEGGFDHLTLRREQTHSGAIPIDKSSSFEDVCSSLTGLDPWVPRGAKESSGLLGEQA